MKKIISLGVASAVLALTAVAASADGAGVKAELVSGEFTTGSTVVYDIVASGEGVENAQVYLEATGLEFVSAEGKNNFMVQPNGDNTFLAIASGSAAADGATIASITYKVTAAEGDAVKFALKADPTYDAVAVDSAAVTDTTVGAATESTDSTPSDVSGDESGDVSGDESTDNSGADTENPGTGVALAVIPAVIAGAAVVVAVKKRK